MSGIAGYIGTSKLDPGSIDTSVKLMRWQGPDHAAFFRHSFVPDRHVCLLHSRLGIIDLDERANQPFRIGSKVLVYSGELYNYLELKQELAAYGLIFSTESDTGVLLRAIIPFGWQGRDKCEGMWAFAVYDEGVLP